MSHLTLMCDLWIGNLASYILSTSIDLCALRVCEDAWSQELMNVFAHCAELGSCNYFTLCALRSGGC